MTEKGDRIPDVLDRKRLVRTDELTEVFGRSARTLYRWGQEGKLPMPVRGLWDSEGVKRCIEFHFRDHKTKT